MLNRVTQGQPESLRLAVYISGHGFGHLAQLAPVLNAVYRLRPDTHYLIRCALPEAELRARLSFDFQLDGESVDTGVIQRSAIDEERDASIVQLREWLATIDERVDREVELLRDFKPTLVLSNISPLAFPAARTLGVTSIALATLDWHTIYSHWLPADDPILTTLAAAYGAADLLLSPPMAMTMPVFPRQQTIPLIAAIPSGLPSVLPADGRKRALVIFGGSGQPAFDMDALAAMSDWQFLIPDAPAHAPTNVMPVSFDASMRPVDLMPHVDLVVCKPGYGILSECWRTATPIAWVERPGFPEFPMLKGWLDDRFPSAGMSRADFAAGHWQRTLDDAIASQRTYPAIDEDGALHAANLICYRKNEPQRHKGTKETYSNS